MAANADESKIRLDKWLWAARFFKTRSLASAAVNGGKVQVNDARAKPAREVRLGDVLTIRREPYAYQVVVTALSDQRGPASAAAQLYQETAASIAQRTALAEQRRLHALAAPQPGQRPSKQERRRIIRFRRQDDV